MPVQHQWSHSPLHSSEIVYCHGYYMKSLLLLLVEYYIIAGLLHPVMC